MLLLAIHRGNVDILQQSTRLNTYSDTDHTRHCVPRPFMLNGYTIPFYHSQTQQTLSYGVHYIRKPEILRLQHLYSPY